MKFNFLTDYRHWANERKKIERKFYSLNLELSKLELINLIYLSASVGDYAKIIVDNVRKLRLMMV